MYFVVDSIRSLARVRVINRRIYFRHTALFLPSFTSVTASPVERSFFEIKIFSSKNEREQTARIAANDVYENRAEQELSGITIICKRNSLCAKLPRKYLIEPVPLLCHNNRIFLARTQIEISPTE